MVKFSGRKKSPSLLVESGLAYFGIGVLIGFFFFGGSEWTGSHSSSSSSSTLNSSASSLEQEVSHPKAPKVINEVIEGTPVLWTKPANIPDSQLEGILFVAHGCGHAHTDWFQNCPGCLGLPEERAIVQDALENNLVVVAATATDKISKCWNPANDLQPIGAVLKSFHERFQSKEQKELQSQQSLPIYTFGASSGGGFVSSISTQMQQIYGISIKGFISQIAAVKKDMSAPCQVFITMDRDVDTEAMARKLVHEVHLEIDQMEDAEGDKFRTRQIQVPPMPIHNTYFASRIPEISLEESSKMVNALRDAELLYPDGLLAIDPRRSNWREVLSPLVSKEKDSLLADKSPIAEVLNVAYGKHEMTREGVHEALLFCMNKKSPKAKKQQQKRKKKLKEKAKSKKLRGHEKWYEQTWDSWPDEVRDAAEHLGYTMELWEAGKDPEAIGDKWSSLTEDQRASAKMMGYKAETWNADK